MGVTVCLCLAARACVKSLGAVLGIREKDAEPKKSGKKAPQDAEGKLEFITGGGSKGASALATKSKIFQGEPLHLVSVLKGGLFF